MRKANKNTLEALRESEEKFRSLVEHALEGILILDLQGTILFANHAAARTIEADDYAGLIGRNVMEFIAPESREDVAKDFIEVSQGHDAYLAQYNAISAKGNKFCVESIGKVISYEGKPADLISIRDITDQKNADTALRESEATIRALMNSPVDTVILLDRNGIIVDANETLATRQGVPVEQLKGRCVYDLISPDLAESRRARIEEVGRTGIPDRFEDQRVGHWFDNSLHPIRDADGNVTKIAIIARDVTEFKKAQEALRESEAKYRMLIETLNEGIWVIDKDAVTTFVNPKMAEILGYTVEEMEGRSLFSFMDDEGRRICEHNIKRRQQGIKERHDFEFLKKDGTRIYTSLEATPVKSNDGEYLGAIAGVTDITERKKAEEFRERLIYELAQKNTELERFTYTVSHDLKSPLITIRGFLHLLEKDAQAGDAERLHDDIMKIHAAAKKMEDFIAALLELSRIGRIASLPVNISLASIVHDAAEQLDAQIRERGVTLIIPDNLPEVYGDRMRLLQVFTNLLENAVKFMGDQKKPIVEISVCHKESEEMICIQDNGIGIAPGDREKIFLVFTRLNPGIAGTGIGLAVVKRIVDVHGGRCWVESEGKGKGSRFYFTLPETQGAGAGAGVGR